MLVKRWVPSPFFSSRSAGCPLDMIVIHHIGSKDGKLYSVSGAVAWFTNENLHRNPRTGAIENKVSAHYIIPRDTYDGTADMIALVRHDNVAFHAGESSWKVGGQQRTNINNYSIGIELEGDGNLVEYTDFQYDRLAELVRELVQNYDISENNIVGHEDVAPDRKVDPGRLFDWKRLRSDISPQVQVVVPTPDPVPDIDFYMGSGDVSKRGFFSFFSRLFNK